ncbi:gp53-like domain-containing protein [Pseudomonas guariconensis]
MWQAGSGLDEAQLGTVGHTILPSGLTILWGRASVATTSAGPDWTHATFSKACPTYPVSVNATKQQDGGAVSGNFSIHIGNVSRTGFDIGIDSHSAGSAVFPVFWSAICY